MKDPYKIIFASFIVMLVFSAYLMGRIQTSSTTSNQPQKTSQVESAETQLPPTPTLSPEEIKKDIFRLVNEERIKKGLKPLKENDKLDNSANLKLDDLINKKYYSHISPDGLAPWYFFKKAGYSYKDAGENLAKGYNLPALVVENWMASKEHKENILNKNFTETGIAVRYDDLISSIVVQHFASPYVNTSNKNQHPSRTGKIISYHEWCTGKDISIYENELITKKSSDGKTYTMTEGDWVCYENYLKK